GVYEYYSTVSGEATIIYYQVGNYTAVLRVTDNAGNTATDSCIIRVYPPSNQPPTANAGSNRTIYAGETVYFNGIGSDPDGYIVLYEWDFNGDGVWDYTSPSTGAASWTYTAGGVYTAVLRVTDNYGAKATSTCTITVLVITNRPPVANAGPDINGVANSSVFLNGTDGYIVLYEWDFEDDGVYDYASASSGQVNHTYTLPGTYLARLRVKDNNGSYATDTCVVRIARQNFPPVAFAGEDCTVYVGEQVRLVGTGHDPDGTITAWAWNFGDGNSSFSTSTGAVTHIYTAPGRYTAVLTVYDNEGANGTDTVNITVIRPNRSPVAYAGEPSTVVQGQMARLSGTGYDEDGSIVLYEWDFYDDGSYDWYSTSNGVVSIRLDQIGNFTMRLRVTDNDGATNTSITWVNVVSANMAPTVSLPTQSNIYLGRNSTLTCNAGDADGYIVLYDWDIDGDGIYDISTTSSQLSFVPERLGNFTFRVRVKDNSGAYGYANGTYTVLPAPNKNPEITGLSYPDAYPDTPVLFQLHAQDTDGTVVSYHLDFNADGVYEIESSTNYTTYIFSKDGDYRLKVKVYDNSGGNASAEFIVVVNKKTDSKPVITIISPENGTITAPGHISIVGTASDDKQVLLVEVSVSGREWVSASGTVMWTYTYDASGQPDGDLVFRARAYDGTQYSDTATVVVKLSTPQPPESKGGIPGFELYLVLFATLILGVIMAISRKRV
ncbi:MAG: PKD domain-containing protein, partial [Thermoplasmata archaeon]